MNHRDRMQRSPASVPSVAIGDFVKYDGRSWIVVDIWTPSMSSPIFTLIDEWGGTATWSANERINGFLAPVTPAKAGKARGELEKQAKKWKLRNQ